MSGGPLARAPGPHERMHRVLKVETAHPPAANRRRQQVRFDRFRDECNQARPHGTRAQHPPATQIARSAREYPERVPDPEYPLYWERRRVRRDGSLGFQGHQPHQALGAAAALGARRRSPGAARLRRAPEQHPVHTR